MRTAASRRSAAGRLPAQAEPRPAARGAGDTPPAATPPARRRAALALAAAPLLLLIAALPRLAGGPAPLLAYGALVLTMTSALLAVAYGWYDDPAERVMRRRPAGLHAFPALPEHPRTSFLLAVKDEREGIEDCVRSMVASDCPNLQIIVVDDGSTDGTREVLRRLAAELPVEVLFLRRNVGKKRALVRAARRAEGQVLAFTDSDCVLAPDALRRCVLALVRHPELGAVSGHARARNAEATLLTRVQDAWYEGQFRIAKAAESAVGAVTCISGPLAVFRADAVLDYLPAWAGDRFLGAEFRFATDRQLTGYVLGQRWRGARLKRRHPGARPAGDPGRPELPWRTAYVASARVWTTVPERLRPFLRQQVRWKKSFLRNLCFSGGFMWRRGPVAALFFYGHVLLVLAAPALAFRHLLCGPAGGLWLPAVLYLAGILLKGVFWGLAFRLDHPGSTRWRYRPLMSLLSVTVLSWLLPYALLTLRRGVWSRGAS
ncbi:glycosyltransferase family 2 protein [Streptomyces hoynatensis]|uniref:Hyaluronan synthase n=1 Tax=Streptomyces hoynatensis TaxID=1141874 RepID=A0A3A9YPV5_9ACTN|nr:glycosyltransferase [Streptomyces hoynatensis]RKN38010.1 glycosyltransferase family 2 protein [Streptomyces hoynatensis]